MYQAQSSNAKYIDLARAKSEAPFNIYSLLKQNVKSCNANGEGNENGEKTKIGLISKKATWHVEHTFFVHFFAVVLHDYNVKLPEASWLHVLWRKCRTRSCSLFFPLSLIFTQVAASISHFLTAATKFHVVPPAKNVSFVFSISF